MSSCLNEYVERLHCHSSQGLRGHELESESSNSSLSSRLSFRRGGSLGMSRLAEAIVASLVLLSACSTAAASSALNPRIMGTNGPPIDEAEQRLRLAYAALNAADELGVSGAEVSVLANRLNNALDLLSDARVFEKIGNGTAASEYASRSGAISDSVREDAEDFGERTSEALFSKRFAIFALAPVVGLIGAVVFYLAYRGRRRPSMEKILRMGIRRKQEDG